MKKYIFTLWIILSVFSFVSADNYCDTLRYWELYASDWTYLWVLTNNYLDPDSIANPLWLHWSQYQVDSIFNPYQLYWSKYQQTSPWNKFSVSDAPYIYKWNWYRRLSLNKFIQWWLNTFDVILCFIDPFDERLKNYKDLDEDNILLSYQIGACQSDFGINSTVAEERWKCKCKIWYKRDNSWTSCISMNEDEKCKSEFWSYAYSPEPGYCNCLAWYQWNWSKTSCVKSINYNNTNSYTTTNTTNITTVDCSIYWPEAIATSNGQCTCEQDYEWNYNKNWCVADRNNKLYWGKDFRNAKDWGDYINMLLDFEWEIEQKSKTENNTTTNFEKTYTRKSDELKDAIQWMYDNWLTMYNTLPDFLPYNEITREQASKFFVEFAVKVLWKNRWNIYSYNIFSDIDKADPTLKDHIIYANNMWLFKWSNWRFMPFNKLTKAQAIAVVIRMVDWYLDESWTTPYDLNKWTWYARYSEYVSRANYSYNLNERWVYNNFDTLDKQNITRWDVAILLYDMYLLKQNNCFMSEIKTINGEYYCERLWTWSWIAPRF